MNNETPGLKELIEAMSVSEKNLQIPGVSIANSLLEEILIEFSQEIKENSAFNRKFKRFEREKANVCVEGNKRMMENFVGEIAGVLKKERLGKEAVSRLNRPIDYHDHEKLRRIQGNKITGEFSIVPPSCLPTQILNFFMVFY